MNNCFQFCLTYIFYFVRRIVGNTTVHIKRDQNYTKDEQYNFDDSLSSSFS